MIPAASRRSFTFGATEVVLETGRIARQAGGAVLLRSGGTVVLATAVAAEAPREGTDFFPLTVEYRERMAAVGRVPGGYFRREGRIAEHEVLESRLIDRSVRPLFPKGYRCEVQVQVSVLSAEPDADPGVLGLLAAGAALHLSAIPFHGPAGGLRVARIEGNWVWLPGMRERERADLDFVVSTSPQGLVMVEGGALERAEEECVEALALAEEKLALFHREVEAWREELGVAKQTFAAEPLPEETRAEVERLAAGRLAEALAVPEKAARRAAVRALRAEVLAALAPERQGAAREVLGELEHAALRARIVEQGVRADGRGAGDVRPIWGEVGWLPRTHGSAIFTRGETQALVSCTLGTPTDEMSVERLFGTEKVRFLLHYNFPPYSVGEVRALRGPGRREIGHGALARHALLPVLPDAEAFPYVVRVESEISESNGSSSMATVCGGCLAMMDAGVPLARPVAGVAMGLIREGDRTVVLTDILGDEDHLGDMDFKVAGTTRGVTAVQMDNKVGGLGREDLARALEQAREARLRILEKMAGVLAGPRADLAAHAPRMLSLRVRPELIGAVIGPRGATIRAIEGETGARLSIGDDGLVSIYAAEQDPARKALAMVRRAAGEVEVGRCYRGTVVALKEFGAFVRIYDNAEGLVHVSELAHERVRNVEDVLREGEQVVVKVLGVDDRGRIRLSRKEALDVDPALVQD